MFDNKQQIQEKQYRFPYHYIPEWSRGFSQVRSMKWGYEYASYMEFVVNLLGEFSPERVLDVGCGDGRLIYEMRKCLPEVSVSGIDYSPQAVLFAKAFNPGIQFHVADITDSSFSIGTYDTITLVETLEHIPLKEIEPFAEGLARLLDDRGRLIVTVPCANVPVSKKHYQHFTLRHLEDTLASNFKLEKSYYTNAISIKEKIIKRFMHSRFFDLNIKKLNSFLYHYYKRNLFNADSRNAQRIIGIFVKK